MDSKKRGDVKSVADMTKARGLNKGKGYSWRYVYEVLNGHRSNDAITALLRELNSLRGSHGVILAPDPKQSIGQRLEHWIDSLGVSLRQASIKCNVNANTLHKAVRKSAGVHTDTIVAILEAYPDLSPDWLLMGKGPMRREDSSKAIRDAIPVSLDYTTHSTSTPMDADREKELALYKELHFKLVNKLLGL